jgi:hypothetical protein
MFIPFLFRRHLFPFSRVVWRMPAAINPVYTTNVLQYNIHITMEAILLKTKAKADGQQPTARSC